MRLGIPPYAFVLPAPLNIADVPATPVRRPAEAAAAPAANKRLRVELVVFSVLLFLNFVKYFVLGVGLGCG
jgi:hypothetical protein